MSDLRAGQGLAGNSERAARVVAVWLPLRRLAGCWRRLVTASIRVAPFEQRLCVLR